MKRRSIISAYTPSNTNRELLKRIFVQRERLLERIVDRLAASILTDDKHHFLLIGPRGSGKTHLVTLAEYELSQRGDLSDTMRVAWLGEDDTYSGLIDLAVGIADRLASEYPEEFPADYRESVRGLGGDDAAESILRSIVDRLGERTILLIVENLDRAFAGLGDLGQRKWRAFLQERPRFATLATSQQLFSGIGSRDEAFFGFFDIKHLVPLSVDDARELIRRISLEQGNSDLVAYLDTAEGRYRIRALHHLAGGNHRMYVLLAEFLTKQSLDDLVAAFEQLAEDLTPYFQERVRSLPPQQARIVQCLCSADGAMTVKEIAEETFIEERSCSKQLGNLKQRRYVQSQRRGKESFYEMAEPLMRLCLEVKNQRGLPLRLVAKFLRAWFPESQLQKISAPASETPSRGDAYRAVALGLEISVEKHIETSLKDEIRKSIDEQQYARALELSNELGFIEPLSASTLSAEASFRSGDFERCADELSRIIDAADAPVELKANALFNRGLAFGQRGDVNKELVDYTAVIETAGAPVEHKARALFNRAVAFGQRGDVEQELADYTALIEMAGAPVEHKTKALIYRGVTFGQRGDAEQETADYTAVIEMADAPAEHKARALFNRGVAFGQRGDVEQELADCTRVIEMDGATVEQKTKALIYRGVVFGQRGDADRKLADYTAVIDMANAPVEQKTEALIYRGVTLGGRGDVDQELADYTAVIEMADASVEQKTKALINRGVTSAEVGEMKQALMDFTVVTDMANVPVERKAHALLLQGVTHWQMGDYEASAQSLRQVLAFQGLSSELRTNALFALPETMVDDSREQVIVAIEHAFREGDSAAEAYGGTPADLLAMVLRRGHQEWEAYLTALVPLYVRYHAAAKLGQGVTQTIELLDGEGYSDSQLDVWNETWQKAGKDCEELEIPLRSLEAAVEAIKTKSDRPLMRLPLEIRELVRPLLAKSLPQ